MQKQLESVQNVKVLTGINPERRKCNMTGIYSIKNIITDKKYIGQAFNIKKRVAKHFYELRGRQHHCSHLQRSFIKHGEQSFASEIIEICSRENLTEREQYWIDYYKDRGIYNVALAAVRSTLGTHHSAKTKNKIAAALKGKKRSPECCARISASQTGKKRGPRAPFSIETRAKMAAAACGRVLSPEHKVKIAASLIGNTRTLGHKLSNEHKAKIGAATASRELSKESRNKIAETLRGHIVSPNTRGKISKAMCGKFRSDEVKAKIKATMILRYQSGIISRGVNGNFASCHLQESGGLPE